MTFSKSTALELCALNEAAHTLATTGHCILPAGFSAPIAIRMPAVHRPFLLRFDPLDIWGFVTAKNERPYVVFRGTTITSGIDFAQEWAQDALSLPLQPFCGKGKVHLGFSGAYDALQSVIFTAINDAAEADPKLDTGNPVITGHSLGGAIASLFWAAWGLGDLMTFGCPRVGDPEFGKSLWDGQTVRVINAPDIIPDVPTDPPFRHGGYEQKVHGPGSFFDRKLAHALPSYVAGIDLLP